MLVNLIFSNDFYGFKSKIQYQLCFSLLDMLPSWSLVYVAWVNLMGWPMCTSETVFTGWYYKKIAITNNMVYNYKNTENYTYPFI